MKDYKKVYIILEYSLTGVFIEGAFLQEADAKKKLRELQAEKVRDNLMYHFTYLHETVLQE